MKQLTQAVFDGAPWWVKSAVIDFDGEGYLLSIDKSELERLNKIGAKIYEHAKTQSIGYGFDFSNWQNSAIDREFAE